MLFLCGDCMTGRGIDQLLPHPGSPCLRESYIKDARDYVSLAEQISGPIPKFVNFSDIWGDALAVLARVSPHARIINLETAVTTSDDAWEKGINYRMHPGNIGCLRAANIDCCTLANNHVLDWGVRGLLETFDVLQRAGIGFCGAGHDHRQAISPTAVAAGGVRLLVFGIATPSSGVPAQWEAGAHSAGVAYLPDFSDRSVAMVIERCRVMKGEGDISMISIHWGGNWGYEVPEDHRRFAHALIDDGGVDLVHGHSSHHVLGFEIYRGKLILYGCGDFINDYEGIGGYESYRPDLTLMYFPTVDSTTGRLTELALVPMRNRGLRPRFAEASDAMWLEDCLNREGRRLGTRVARRRDGVIAWVPRASRP